MEFVFLKPVIVVDVELLNGLVMSFKSVMISIFVGSPSITA
jgi:hypothetical protein